MAMKFIRRLKGWGWFDYYGVTFDPFLWYRVLPFRAKVKQFPEFIKCVWDKRISLIFNRAWGYIFGLRDTVFRK